MLTLSPSATEPLVPLSVVPRLLPSSAEGKSINLSTVFRWITKGVKGIRLEAVLAGGRWYTSEESLRRFMTRLTEMTLPTGATILRSPSQACVAANHASFQLEARGA
jgi:hypothetical protein